MQLVLQVRGQDLRGNLFLENEALVEYVSTRLQEPQNRLIRQGFEAPVFNCRIKEQK